ncbi:MULTISPECIES: sensor histidine kinase [Brevibacterium]|uniref:histidine kinase n=1 Tax=Brevibacterium casei TaxID=33889 RepID=A0A7T4A0E4_9MICO|nr:sensor histidine kinase [Brevibacterium casei]QQB14967.1 sensor histidine kinase [Brevibacterium casei]
MAEPITAAERRPRARDWYLVAALGIGSAVFAALYNAGGFWPFKVPLWASCLASLIVPLPLVFRRTHPSLVAWVVSALYIAAQFLGMMEPGVSQITLFLAVYSIGAWQSNRQAAFMSRLLLCIAIFASIIGAAVVQLSGLGELTVLQYAANSGITFLINLLFFGGAWVFGDRAWTQRHLVGELRAANDEVRRQEQQLADQALDLERVRIARELHDGVAHHIAGVGIHAAAARRSLERNPDRARESLQTIEASTRETVDELRTLVYTLRDTSSASAAANRTSGTPGLADLTDLYADARRSGQHLDVATYGTPHPLTAITELSVYRVIQESLTNSKRYAGPGAEVVVRLRYGPSDLEVEISDSSPTGERAGQSSGTGLGIVGMRERMSALGGTLDAGPKSRGGWLVRARIPYTRPETEPTPTTAATAPEPASSTATPVNSSTPMADQMPAAETTGSAASAHASPESTAPSGTPAPPSAKARHA